MARETGAIENMAKETMEMTELREMRDNVRRVVESLEVCWRCQHVCECKRHILGNLVLIWLCHGCLRDMVESQAPELLPTRRSSRVAV